MRNVGLGHDQTIIADLSQHAAARGAAMDGHELTNLVPFANPRLGRFSLVLQVLRRESDRDKGKNLSSVAYSGWPIDYAMRFKTHSITAFHFLSHDGIRPYITI